MLRFFVLGATTMALLLATGAGTASAAYETLVAPESACPNQANTSLSVDVQEAAMLCMVNYARTRSALPVLSRSALLMDSADRKARDMVRCRQFSHTACGLAFDRRIRDVGYRFSYVGENIAWGSGSYGTVRRTMTNWLNSTGHRNNILNRNFRDQGIALVKGSFQGYSNAQVWVNHFASPA